MKNRFFVLLSVFSASFGMAQNEISWREDVVLQLSDFQSPATQIGNVSTYSLQTASGFGFSFYMSNFEFMFTKNFNNKVSNNFSRSAAALVAPDEVTAVYMVGFAQYQFDLAELFARKFRKKLFEEKSAFSSVDFVKPFYEQVQNEFSQRNTEASKLTDMGRNKALLEKLRSEVRREIESLPDFCQSCKPGKKKINP